MKISDEALDVFEDAEAKHTFTHGGEYRRCCNRAGLEAAAPLVAAQVLRTHAQDLWDRITAEQDMPSTNRCRQRAAAWAESAARQLRERADDQGVPNV